MPSTRSWRALAHNQSDRSTQHAHGLTGHSAHAAAKPDTHNALGSLCRQPRDPALREKSARPTFVGHWLARGSHWAGQTPTWGCCDLDPPILGNRPDAMSRSKSKSGSMRWVRSSLTVPPPACASGSYRRQPLTTPARPGTAHRYPQPRAPSLTSIARSRRE